MKTLIVTEKFNVVNDFINALKEFGNFNTSTRSERYFENDKYIITWLQGHFLSSVEPKEYDNYMEKGGWSLNALPYQTNSGYRCDYKVNPKVAQEFKKVKKVFARKDYDMVVNACDAEREGELIFWELYDYLNLKTPVKRFWESTVMTKENILNIMKNKLKDESFYGPIRDAAYARQFSDWMLGMNFTTGFTIKSGIRGRALHMGRVKTPTVAILVNRELERLNFVPQHYYEIEASFGKYKGQWFKDKPGNTKLDSQEEVNSVIEKVKGKIGVVTSKEVKKETQSPDKLYNLPALQADVGRKLGLSAKETLDVAQELYDKHKVLSYPRTESRALGEEHVKKIPAMLNSVSFGDYSKYVENIKERNIPTSKHFVNDKELTDHHALVPTEIKPNLDKMSDIEKKVYEMVVKRFLSVFYPDAIYEKTNIVTTVEEETFKTNGKILVDAGWKVIYGGETEEQGEQDEKGKDKKSKDVVLPPIEENEENQVLDVTSEAKETKPPKRFTEFDLIEIMEKPAKLLEDKELKQAMKDAGLGTGATRDTLIEEIVRQQYVERKGKAKTMIPTDLAIKMIEISPEELKSPQITAEWELKLKEVSQGKYPVRTFLDDIKAYVEKNLEELKKMSFTVNFQSLNEKSLDVACPRCGKDVVDKKVVYACQSHTKENPCFRVFKKISEKSITEAQVKQLATKGETGEIKGFLKRDKSGKFNAKLKWNPDKLKVDFAFVEAPKLMCPFCNKGQIRENSKAFGCSNWQGGCKFTVWKNTNGKTITMAIVKELVQKKQTKKLSGFKKADGEEYEARLVLNLEKKQIDRSYK